MTKLDLQSFSNLNLLEYNYGIVKKFWSNYYSFDRNVNPIDSYLTLVCRRIQCNYRASLAKDIINSVAKSFTSTYNSTVIAIEEAKRSGILGKYEKVIIKKKNGQARVVYNASPEFKTILRKFLEVLEYVCFDKYHTKYRAQHVNRKDGEVVYYSANVRGSTGSTKRNNRYRFKHTKQICPHKKSIDSVLADISGGIYTKLPIKKIGIYKIDIKDAFLSTEYSLVKNLLEIRLKEYPLIRDFIINNLEMCFINGRLPPGYPTSNLLFIFVKEIILEKFRDTRHALLKIYSYVDDLYLLYDASNINKELLLTRFQKYLRKWGYRVNKNKTKNIVINHKNKIIDQFKSTSLLGKFPKQISPTRVVWAGSRKHKNKLRMLKYIQQKEQQNSGSSVDPTKDNAEILKQKVSSFEDFYFPGAGSHTYRAMHAE